MAIKFDRFQVENVHFEQVKLPNNETITLPRFNGKEIPHIRLPRIELTCYGVPKLGKYFKTDKDRQFLQLPIQQEVLARFELLDSLMRCSSELQHWMNGAQYVPIVRQGSQGPYIKLKLETDYETGDIETVLFRGVKQADGTIQTEHVDADTMDDVAAVFPLNCSINCEIRLVKVWTVQKTYGITLKLVRANVLQPQKQAVDCSGIEFDF
jgi:hypothetical protein